MPGGAGANGGRKGEVKRDNFGNLQYFDERDGKWSESSAELLQLIMERNAYFNMQFPQCTITRSEKT